MLLLLLLLPFHNLFVNFPPSRGIQGLLSKFEVCIGLYRALIREHVEDVEPLDKVNRKLLNLV